MLEGVSPSYMSERGKNRLVLNHVGIDGCLAQRARVLRLDAAQACLSVSVSPDCLPRCPGSHSTELLDAACDDLHLKQCPCVLSPLASTFDGGAEMWMGEQDGTDDILSIHYRTRALG